VSHVVGLNHLVQKVLDAKEGVIQGRVFVVDDQERTLVNLMNPLFMFLMNFGHIVK
jgi:hypothetical protein